VKLLLLRLGFAKKNREMRLRKITVLALGLPAQRMARALPMRL
jgi:hypothetical protein